MMKGLAVVILFLSFGAWGDSNIRVGILGGFAQSLAQSGSNAQLEGPTGIAVNVDFRWYDAYYLQVEEMRSLGSSGSTVGMTGLSLKYYPWANPEHWTPISVMTEKSFISMDGYMPFFGVGTGVGQASMPATGNYASVVGVNMYLGIKAGVDIPFRQKWTWVGEFNYVIGLLGTSSLTAMNLLGGISYRF